MSGVASPLFVSGETRALLTRGKLSFLFRNFLICFILPSFYGLLVYVLISIFKICELIFKCNNPFIPLKGNY